MSDFWTPALDDALKAELNAGSTYDAIARMFTAETGMPVTRSMIAGRVRYLRTKERTERQRKRILKRLEDEMIGSDGKPRKIMKNVPIWNLEHGMCRYITHMERDEDGRCDPHKTTYCGLPTLTGSSYCEMHHKVTYHGKVDIKRLLRMEV